MDKKTLIGGGIGVAVALAVAMIWNTFFLGVETNVGNNPKILALETKLDAHIANFNSFQSETIEIHATARAERAAIISNQDRILDALIGD